MWPWITALVLFCCFAAGCWQWNGQQPWYSTSASDVEALVGRVSEGQASRQIGFLVLGLYGLGLLAMPGTRAVKFKPVLFYLLLLFIIWAFISLAWSADHAQTAKRLVVFASMCLTVAGVIKHYDIRQMAQIACIASTLTLLSAVAIEVHAVAGHFPGVGLYRFSGMLHPNHQALNCGVVILSSLYLVRIEQRRWLLILAAIALAALMLTKSRTALMAIMSGVAFYWLFAASTKRAVMTLLICAWIGGGVMWLNSLDVLPSFSSVIAMGRSDLKKQDPRELTGRTAIWKFALMQADKDPNRTFIGYGFETFWTPANVQGVSQFVNFNISEGHNIYLDWYLELGLVGAGLYGVVLLSALLRWTVAARVLESPSCAIAAGIIVGAIVHGFAESSLGDASLPTFFFYTSIALSTLARPDELEDAV